MSENETFDDFVKRQRDRVAVDATFYDQQKKEWLEFLNQLYAEARSYLEPYIVDGIVKIDSSSVVLNEEGMGSYEAPTLTIAIGVQQISFTPIGTMLIGSKGRVDVQGSRGIARLSLINKKLSDARSMIKVTVTAAEPSAKLLESEAEKSNEVIDWAWKIVSAPPNVTFIDLTKESFLSMLQEVSGG